MLYHILLTFVSVLIHLKPPVATHMLRISPAKAQKALVFLIDNIRHRLPSAFMYMRLDIAPYDPDSILIQMSSLEKKRGSWLKVAASKTMMLHARIMEVG